MIDTSFLSILIVGALTTLVLIGSALSETYTDNRWALIYHNTSKNLLIGTVSFAFRVIPFLLLMAILTSIWIECTDLAHFAVVRTETYSSQYIYYTIGFVLCAVTILNIAISLFNKSTLEDSEKAYVSPKISIVLKTINAILIALLMFMGYMLHIRYYVDNIELVEIQLKRYAVNTPDYIKLIAIVDELHKEALAGYNRIYSYIMASVAQFFMTFFFGFINQSCENGLTLFHKYLSNKKINNYKVDNDVNNLDSNKTSNKNANVTTTSLVPSTGFNQLNNKQLLFDTFFSSNSTNYNQHLSSLKHNGKILDAGNLSHIYNDLHNRDTDYSITLFIDDFTAYSATIKRMIDKQNLTATSIKDINKMYFNIFGIRYSKYNASQRETFFTIA